MIFKKSQKQEHPKYRAVIKLNASLSQEDVNAIENMVEDFMNGRKIAMCFPSGVVKVTIYDSDYKEVCVLEKW